ncbi:MAG: glyceraldehyde-3-phosphate dehydrogenase [Bacteroidetes bacterium]|nr:glyceraldehyde-3-phosphate dehydrogenase [Bacteroidota bacterium]
MSQPITNESEFWIDKEKQALELISIVGTLWFDHSIELILFRRGLVDARPSEILNHHEYGRNYIHQPLTLNITLMLARAIAKLDMAPARIDIGVLGKEWLDEGESYKNADDFVGKKFKDFIGQHRISLEPKDVVLYGFGRIGRLAARELITQTGKGQQLRLRAIVTRSNDDLSIRKRASLMRKDSVHGKFRGTVIEDLENKALIINGHHVQMIAANSPDQVDYEQYGIKDALVIDNTGVWRDQEGLSKHLKSKGASNVLLTAPGKGNIPNIVHGVNHRSFDADSHNIWSAASCTTNAIVPVIDAIDKAFGIEGGHIESVHSYTNDQNLLDNFHKKYRRGRSAATNMVITETGAAKAVSKVLPELAGRLTGNAVRVPTPNVSLAILNLNLKSQVENAEAVNYVLNEASAHGQLIEQIDFSTSNEFVSSDCVGNSHASVVDAPATIVSNNKKSIVLYVWYDNEYGYTRQVVRLAKYLSKVIRLTYY